ncbi:choline/ethanolamine phosphotransferase [Kipferlia bialata]|uniref:Choline/ethanolamine phosphotransferase n=1 Tax=Kipferlia bialata TaxID=797122 RepID=A0A9K3CY25_9EUKA|nr:choline/ethanolamine phosphotransferase [Kipferlia bialata]|eukprot:g6983.t1
MASAIPAPDGERETHTTVKESRGEREREVLSPKSGWHRVVSHLPVPSVLSGDAIHNLTHYKYTGIDLSLVSRHLLQPIWTWQAQHVMDRVPWLSPNGVTLIELRWVDGIHARRTHTCSCLGQLFDHGVDSLAVTVFMTTLLLLIRCPPLDSVLGVPVPWAVLIAGVAGATFVAYQAEEFLCHVLKLDIVSFPVEGILLAGALCLYMSVRHTSHYTSTLPALSYLLANIPMLIGVGATLALWFLTYTGAKGGMKALEDRQRERDGETVPGTPGIERSGASSGPVTPHGMSHKVYAYTVYAESLLVPLVLTGAAWYWSVTNPAYVYAPVLYTSAMGVALAECAIRCTVARLTGVVHPATVTVSVSPLIPFTVVPLVSRHLGLSGMAEIHLSLATALVCFAVYFVGCVALPISRTLDLPLIAMRRQKQE